MNNTTLTDFATLVKRPLPAARVQECTDIVNTLFAKAEETVLTQEEAVLALDSLAIDSHARLLREAPKLKTVLPVLHYTKNKLAKVSSLWWMDHFTGGLNARSTVNWFATQPVSTHFVCDFTGRPYYIVPLMHGTWHEPRRNHDSVSIEMVNPGPLTQSNDTWRNYAGKIPYELLEQLPPVRLAKPYRGATALLPFTRSQVVNNLLLKRIVIAAMPGRFIPERMTQHSDWRATKCDMGPLWVLQQINTAAFERDPILEYDFIQTYDDGTPGYDYTIGLPDEDYTANPMYKADIEPHGLEHVAPWDTRQVQEYLIKGWPPQARIEIDGDFGPQTKAAVMEFQRWYNKNHTAPNAVQLTVDGIPGPLTLGAMQALI